MRCATRRRRLVTTSTACTGPFLCHRDWPSTIRAAAACAPLTHNNPPLTRANRQTHSKGPVRDTRPPVTRPAVLCVGVSGPGAVPVVLELHFT